MSRIVTPQKQKPFLKSRAFRISLATALAVVLLGGVLEFTGVTHLFHKKYAATHTVTAGQATKGEPAGGAITSGSTSSGTTPGSSGDTNSTEPGDNKGSVSSGSPGAAPETPSGNFVSNHHPNLSGSPAPSLEQSVCSTTTGATCQITFTKDGVTKSLDSTSTDRGGAAYWTWDVKSLGLAAGSWKVTAIATLNGQTATASDTQTLDVQP
ncbi:MAG TPA: hypothetical protein VLG11_03380 [Candidatus Saccharimonadales bacterium]|nr:hypothetical protein [Candidatus Saccharimonadales bacterium]